VLESHAGEVIGFEVKSVSRVAGTDFAGLGKLRDTLGPSFIAGVALDTGARSYTHTRGACPRVDHPDLGRTPADSHGRNLGTQPCVSHLKFLGATGTARPQYRTGGPRRHVRSVDDAETSLSLNWGYDEVVDAQRAGRPAEAEHHLERVNSLCRRNHRLELCPLALRGVPGRLRHAVALSRRRVLAAIGTTDAVFEPDHIDVAINGVQVCRAGGTKAGEPADTVDMSPRHVRVDVALGAGSSSATLLTSDLTHDYVHENSAYST
jgi:hypothetical protein